MPLVPCPVCRRDLSTAAAACPHCGHPMGGAPAPPAATRPQCYSCGRPSTRACTRCGSLCCEDHITWWGSPYKNYGATCSSCASFGWVMTAVGVVVFGIIALIIFSNMRRGPFGP